MVRGKQKSSYFKCDGIRKQAFPDPPHSKQEHHNQKCLRSDHPKPDPPPRNPKVKQTPQNRKYNKEKPVLAGKPPSVGMQKTSRTKQSQALPSQWRTLDQTEDKPTDKSGKKALPCIKLKTYCKSQRHNQGQPECALP